jgi:hypothetical protein
MTRGVRMLLVFLFLMGVIMLMMDCAKKSMHKKKPHQEGGEPSHGWLQPERPDHMKDRSA